PAPRRTTQAVFSWLLLHGRSFTRMPARAPLLRRLSPSSGPSATMRLSQKRRKAIRPRSRTWYGGLAGSARFIISPASWMAVDQLPSPAAKTIAFSTIGPPGRRSLGISVTSITRWESASTGVQQAMMLPRMWGRSAKRTRCSGPPQQVDKLAPAEALLHVRPPQPLVPVVDDVAHPHDRGRFGLDDRLAPLGGVVGHGEVHAVAEVLAEPLGREREVPAVVGEDDVLLGEARLGQDVGEVEVGLPRTVPGEEGAVALHDPERRQADVLPQPVVARHGGEAARRVVAPAVERAPDGVADDRAALADVHAEVGAVGRLAVHGAGRVPPQHEIPFQDPQG